MGIKNFVKKLCYGANRNSRDEIIQAVESIKGEMLAQRINFKSEFQNLRQELYAVKNQNEELKSINIAYEQLLKQIQEECGGSAENKIHTQIDTVQRDILLAISQKENFLPEKRVQVITDYPIACESNDHLVPWGTKNDNTRAPHFVRKCEELLGEHLNFMDLGCSGGGLVLDEILKGHFAIGLEGSDYSQKHQRAEWRLLKNNLFTCDVSKPFEVRECVSGNQIQFDIITAWELLEHIEETDIPVLLNNIYNHLADSGYFVGTMAQQEDVVDGVQYHHTVRNYDWWKNIFEKNGFQVVQDLFAKEDLARGNGNPPNVWMVGWGEENSSYIVAKKQNI